jgi:hypothetical protein
MNRDLHLTLLRAVLPEDIWTEDRFAEVRRELRVLADHKYNKYEMYQPGRLFFEHLYLFLSRLESADRTVALDFVRRSLIFISRDEFQQLAHILHYDYIRQRHLDVTSAISGIPRHRLARLKASPVLGQTQRASLYVALSDGARIDYFRRHNLEINNEQVLASYDPGSMKLEDLSAKLIEANGDPQAKFDCLFLLDDFCGSGRTLIREVVTAKIAEPLGTFLIPPPFRGQLSYDSVSRMLTWQYRGAITAEERSALESLSSAPVYRKAIAEITEKSTSRSTDVKGALAKISKTDLMKLVSDRARLFFTPLLATQYALDRMIPLVKRLPSPLDRLEILPAATLPDSARIRDDGGALAVLCRRYYSADLGDEHTGDVTFGYDACGLPIVLHHNTPNNSVYWLWSRKWDDPLFVRYERHGREASS